MQTRSAIAATRRPGTPTETPEVCCGALPSRAALLVALDSISPRAAGRVQDTRVVRAYPTRFRAARQPRQGAIRDAAHAQRYPDGGRHVAVRTRTQARPRIVATRRLHGMVSGLSGSSARSEEHTSELQSLRHLVCRLL